MGSGLPVVAIHGNGVDHRLLLSLDDALAEAGGLERWYVDLPGFGSSDRSDRPYTIRLYVDAVHDALDAIEYCNGPADSKWGALRAKAGHPAPFNLKFMEIIDRQFLETPWYSSRQMVRHMPREGHRCGRHRVRRLMKLMRLVPIHQEPRTSPRHPEHRIYPYRLRGPAITPPIRSGAPTPMRRGFLYLVAIMDWHSRKVLS